MIFFSYLFSFFIKAYDREKRIERIFTSMNQHNIQFSKLANFREVGGLQTTDQMVIKQGMIYRSADLSRLTKQDILTFSTLGIQTICDLRTSSERKSHPPKIMEHDKIVHIPMQPDSMMPSKWTMFRMLIAEGKSLSFTPIMKEVYQSMLYERKKEIQQLFTLLSDEKNYPLMLHCTSGKDRTGFLSALIQLAAGVPVHTVLSEYMRSNEGVKMLVKRQERFVRMMSLYRVSKEQIQPLLGVQQDYLEDVLNEMMDTYGNAERYLVEACDVPKAQLLKVKNILLTPSAGIPSQNAE
ncbi:MULTISPECIES: tyrosine-protein phosphatase [Bacillus]|uniref:tyrosine-protein phosphatase n=1 Tax=Bacillus TaxID=1386 RepID=UPI000310B824|nr:tyrosine-protein phosphatase [Bacillus altitudinis]QKL21820.1 tyrosine-protein phosphatase [Bacillus altitudinis]QKL25553.1 tyrosine-protein phosphatase [Bacillus altitudinis]QXY95935.1 tyrosine-protein phosphatase [Bacillus altitudinis]RAU01869.1 protein-tyrosine-phosphatase [Bacillus altitudinis]VXB49359.1 Protein tyrosine phosphatase [Bacillus altitudinis]